MKERWGPFYLDGYLEEEMLIFDTLGYTFVRNFPKTPELPELKVGLGVVVVRPIYVYKFQTIVIPPHLQSGLVAPAEVYKDTFTDAVEEVKEKLSHLPNWQEHLLLELGYTPNFLPGPPVLNDWKPEEDYNLLYHIPAEERGYLLNKHGLHKVATMAAYGYTDNLDSVIEMIEKVRGDADYTHVLQLMTLGIPAEDLPLALRLPIDMVAEMYSEMEVKP